MRPLKFRAWLEYGVGELKDVSRKDKDGNLIKSEMEYGISINENGEYLLISDTHDVWGAYNIPIMQWTGLKDKNGKEVYEGDVVKVGNIGKSEIYYEDMYARFGFTLNHYTKGGDFSFYDFPARDLEVIGNIFTNPELLEQ